MLAFPVVIAVAVALISAIVFIALLYKLIQRNRLTRSQFAVGPDFDAGESESWSNEWFQEFSSFRYLPMRRLLAAEEEEYWVQSTGDNSANRAAFRAERRRLFRLYLRLISSDFSRLSQGVRLSVVHASSDQSAEVQRLFQLEWSFRKLLWKANASLALHWLGVKPVEATKLIDALQGFEFSLREIRIQAASA